MSDDSATHGPAIPVEALQQGSMNVNPFFKTSTGDEPEVESTQFGVGPDGRSKIVLPGRYPTPPRTVRTVGEKTVTLKKGTIERVDH